jgi:hypothetical protein
MSIHIEFARLDAAGEALWMHPTLGALFSVLQEGGDFSTIGRKHEINDRFKYYREDPKWEDDISGLLPETERWWEDLGALQSCLRFTLSYVLFF